MVVSSGFFTSLSRGLAWHQSLRFHTAGVAGQVRQAQTTDSGLQRPNPAAFKVYAGVIVTGQGVT